MSNNYLENIRKVLTDPKELENLYRLAVREKEEKLFTEAIEALYREMPDNSLIQSWHYRLTAETTSIPSQPKIPWLWAVLTGIPLCILFWWLADFEKYYVHGYQDIPWLIFIWAPLVAVELIVFLTLAGKRHYTRLALIIGGLLFLISYIYFADALIQSEAFKNQYTILAAIHLILIAWAAVGFYALAGQDDAESRFAYYVKSLEAGTMAGLFLFTLLIFTVITFILFKTLGLHLTDSLIRRLIFGGAGFIPSLAVASIYHPILPMKEQILRADLSKLLGLILRLFILPAILVLALYISFTPFRFKEPFYNRETLIAFNVMLFAVIALLFCILPRQGEILSSKSISWLKRGAMLLNILAELISLYALSAIIFRTLQDGFTPNRITVIGWNFINITLLGILLYQQGKDGIENWALESRKVFARASWFYIFWSLALLLILPWLF